MSNNKKSSLEEAEVIQLSGDQRFQVLVAQMNERYQAWHHMRARSMQFTLWIMGLAVAASWKLLQDPCRHLSQRIATTGLVVLIGAAAAYFLMSLARGVRTNRQALINVETALSAHRDGTFLQGKSVLPPEYKDTRPRLSSHFRTLYALLLVTSVYLLTAIWLPSNCSAERSPNNVAGGYPSLSAKQATPASTTSAPPETEIEGDVK